MNELGRIFFDFANEIFRPSLLIIASVFAVYFAFKKIGNKVTVKYRVRSGEFSEIGIKEVTLSNKKDKPVSVYALHAVFQNDLWLNLDTYSPPKILKPFESLALQIPEHSRLEVEGDIFKADYMDTDIDIYIESDKNMVKCGSHKRPDLISKYRTITKQIFTFNEFVYDETVHMIFVYSLAGSSKTAFIHKLGYIGNEWGCNPNHLGGEATVESFTKMLDHYCFTKLFDRYLIYEVQKLGEVKLLLSKPKGSLS